MDGADKHRIFWMFQVPFAEEEKWCWAGDTAILRGILATNGKDPLEAFSYQVKEPRRIVLPDGYGCRSFAAFPVFSELLVLLSSLMSSVVKGVGMLPG